ncbi:MAG: helix-hairpin-helix domain-containing protein, partial [Armatimonadota bacterium]|nr:helix-hairpin-helix domain-containing protein [Armatimonadota bacterium]
MTNLEIARVLKQVADLLELLGSDRFRVEAYRRAAQNVEAATENLMHLHDQEALRKIPGVGEAIAKKMEELLLTGRLKYLEELQQHVPPGLPALLEVHGLGPKKVRALWQNLGITSIDELEAAAQAQRVRALPGMGAKSEQNILRAIERYRAYRERMRLGDALPYATQLTESLREAAGDAIGRLEIAGSARRRAETVGDLDLVATSGDPERVMDAFIRLPHVKEVTLHGPTRSSIVTAPGLPVDIRIVPPESYGSLLQHLTGSRSHNIRLREMAQRCGATINEYGLFSVETGKRLTPGDDERYVYEFLGLQFIPPELREDRGEIEAASRHQLPRLIEMEEIQGDLHCHTRWSDGAHSVAQMADAARALGYRYLVLTDHSPSLEVARGLSVERLTQRAEEIAAYNAAHPD